MEETLVLEHEVTQDRQENPFYIIIMVQEKLC